MIVRLFLFLVCLVGCLAGEAQAQLFLETGKLVLAVSGGDHLNGTMVIHNTSAVPSDVRVYWEDFQYKPPYDGTKNFLPAGTAPDSASQWINFAPQTFTLPAYGQQTIQYTITVPATMDHGHYGVLFFEKSSEAMTNGEGVTLVARVGCLFFIEPKDKNKKSTLDHVALEGKNVTLDFVNQGNVILIPRTTYYVMSNSGDVLLRGETVKVYVPPGDSGSIRVPLKSNLNPGRYTLVVNSDLDDGDVVVKEIGLNVDNSGQLTIGSAQD